MIYDGPVYGESKVIIQKGNIHNLNRGGADEIDGKCNCLEKWQPSNGIPGVGAVHRLQASSLAGFGYFSQTRVQGMAKWFCSFRLGPRNDSSARTLLSPAGKRVSLAALSECMGLISAPGASSSPGVGIVLTLPTLQSWRGPARGIADFMICVLCTDVLSGAVGWSGRLGEPFKHSFGNQIEFI